MAARSREDLSRKHSSESRMTYREFLRLFPDNTTCLDYLKGRFYPDGSECPKCTRQTKFHRIRKRSAYSCQFCGHQVYPTAGTIFHKSTVNLHLWFYGIFLMSSTRCGMAAKQLEREIGVSYPTALRMFRAIRQMLVDRNGDGPLLGGEIEADETAYGGKPRAAETRETAKLTHLHAPRTRAYTKKPKATVFAAVERGGQVRATVVPNRKAKTLKGQLSTVAHPASILFTDDYALYHGLGHTFAAHHTINHSERIYVDGIIHTNTVEGFFSLMKNGIRGVYRNVSLRYLQDYVDEYAFRYNHRHTINPDPMFWNFLDRVEANRVSF